MKIKKWKQFNELQTSTYQSAADKLRTKHPGRADKISAHVKAMELGKIIDKELGNKVIVFHTDEGERKLRVNQIDVDRGSRHTMALSYGNWVIVHVDFSDQENPQIRTIITTRKSANVATQILKNWFNSQRIEVNISVNDVYDSRLGT